MIPDKQPTEYFKDVVWLVQATNEEQYNLWEKYAADSLCHHPNFPKIKWEWSRTGYSVQVGRLDNRPINVSINHALLNDKLVLFYYGMSQLVDWKMIDEWIEFHAEKYLGWKRTGETWPHCNATNFPNCFKVIGVNK